MNQILNHIGTSIETYFLWYGTTVLLYFSTCKCQYMTEAGARDGAGAKILDKGGAGAENK